MSVKGRLYVTKDSDVYSVSGVTLMQGFHLGYIVPKGKAWVSGDKSYPTLDHAVLALARGQNRRFSPRASFHKDRICYEETNLS